MDTSAHSSSNVNFRSENLLANLEHDLLQQIGKLLNDRHRLARRQADAIHRSRRVVPESRQTIKIKFDIVELILTSFCRAELACHRIGFANLMIDLEKAKRGEEKNWF